MMEAITAFITCLSPIIVAYFGYITTRQQKQTKEFIELQTKYNQQNEQMKKQEMEEQQKAIKEIQASVAKLQEQFVALDKRMNIDEINDRLNNILELSHINYEYSQSLSQVICAIGDCIESTHANDPHTNRVSREMERHQEEEKRISARIFKVAY